MGDDWQTGRIEVFSDGVFAIAITLLVLEISVPESAFHDLWRGIADQWPAYLAYATSFITIGGIWAAHHRIFRRLQYANQRLMVLNLLLLMVVAFLPGARFRPTTERLQRATEAGVDAPTAIELAGTSEVVESLAVRVETERALACMRK